MMEDEETPRHKRVEQVKLDVLSVADLRAYIGELQAEIARVEEAIARKDGARGLAESFFRRSGD